MKVNQKVRYGVACLYELSKDPHNYTDANLIAHRQEIPPAYAQKVLQLMANAGLVIGQKGVGYKLMLPMEHISILQVMDALSTSEHESGVIVSQQNIVIEQRIKQALGAISLSDLGKMEPNA